MVQYLRRVKNRVERYSKGTCLKETRMRDRDKQLAKLHVARL